MNKPSNDKTTYLKLLNKYADSYNILIEENKSFKKEIRDLRSNVRINKEIIDSLFSSSKHKGVQSCLKFQEEAKALLMQCEALSNERNGLRSKLIQQEQIFSESIGRVKEENALNKTQIFLLEQELIKKSNMIQSQKKKLKSLFDLDNECVKEVYIIDPSKAVAEINDELLLYKKIHQKLLKGMKRSQSTMKRYDDLITELQNENVQLKNKVKLQVMASNRERNTLKGLISQHNRKGTDSSLTKANHSNCFIKSSDGYKMKMKLNLGEPKAPIACQFKDNEDFTDILKNCNMTVTEFERMMKSKAYAKYSEVIEMLFKSLLEKTTSIHLLEVEVDNLNMKNFQLNQENMKLNAENKQLRRSEPQDDSYLNDHSDHSDCTAGRNRTDTTITNYHKFLEKQQEELNEPDIELSFEGKDPAGKSNAITKPILNRSGISDSSSLEEPLNGLENSIETLDSKALDDKCNRNSNTANALSSNSKSSGSISSSEFRKEVSKSLNVQMKDSNGMNSFNSSAFEDIHGIKSNNNV